MNRISKSNQISGGWKIAGFVLLLMLFSAGYAQPFYARYGLGTAAYAEPGDGFSFTVDAEYTLAPMFSTATAFTYVSSLSAGDPASFKWQISDIDTTSSFNGNYALRNKISSVRQFVYFKPLGLLKKSSKHDIGIGMGFGYTNSMTLVYYSQSGQNPRFRSASYSGTWDFVPSVYYQYHLKKWVLGLRLGWETTYRILEGPIAYGQFFVGFKI